ncbi:putative beta-lysine N-acetyltransferase [Desulfoplanes sp. PS50]
MRSKTENTPRDRIESLGKSVIQHGRLSDRVYLMKIHSKDRPGLAARLKKLARDRGYSKIFAKVPEPASGDFLDAGFSTEAKVPGMFQGETTARFMGYYLENWRKTPQDKGLEADVLRTALAKQGPGGEPGEQLSGRCIRELTRSDVDQMAAVYARVFESYPFPIHDPAYLLETMDNDVRYQGVFQDDRLVALASAEIDVRGGNAEMTDFATLPEYRGQGLAGLLLSGLESMLADTGIATVYTIARAISFGMNITFAKNGYEYAGTLVNNTHIAGGLESMNVWYKRLLSGAQREP